MQEWCCWPGSSTYEEKQTVAQRSDCQYDYKPDPWSSHSLIADYLRKLPPGTRVLEVGTARGALADHLRDARLVLCGVEPDPGWAGEAGPKYAAFHQGTLDEAPDAFLAGFGAVVCADVLEHMPAPERSLRRLVQLQARGCRFVVSVPNAVNIWVRLNVLAGRFEYADRGILDRTHLRFFTRATLLRMLAAAGLRVVAVRTSPIPLAMVNPAFGQNGLGGAANALLARATAAVPGLLAYQFVAKCLKP